MSYVILELLFIIAKQIVSGMKTIVSGKVLRQIRST